MRRVFRAAVLLALLITPAIALASGARTYVTNCTHADYKPKLIILACGDAGAYVQGLSWSRWGSTGASGAGTYTIKTCSPDCAQGGTKSFGTSVGLSKPKSCPKTKKGKVFTEIALTFTGTRPAGFRKTFRDKLGCPF